MGVLIIAHLTAARPQSPSHTGTTTPSGQFVVTSRTDSGPGSLRQALLEAWPGDRILFDPVVFPPANPTATRWMRAWTAAMPRIL